MSTSKLAQAVLVTWELLGQPLSDAAVNALLDDLEHYPEHDVLKALDRCRKELRKITLTDVIERLPDQHPGVEEAWNIVAPWVTGRDEDRTFFWTMEMRLAAGAAGNLSNDPVAARMAFKETYNELIREARANNTPPNWNMSQGFNRQLVAEAVTEAVKSGKISAAYGCTLLPRDLIDEKTATKLLGGIIDVERLT